MRVLVLGGTRFMGPVAVRTLHGWGHQVACFHRGVSEADLPAEVERIHGDRARLVEARDAFAAFGPDVLLDMRPVCEADARAVLEVLAPLVRRAVVVSSQDVYRAYGVMIGKEPRPEGGADGEALTEGSPLRSRLYPYRLESPRPADDPMKWADDYDKIPVERAYLDAVGLPCTVLRLPMVYGPGDRAHRLHPYLRAMEAGREAIVLGAEHAAWRATRGYVDDAGRAIALAVAAEHEDDRVYNVGEDQAHTEAEWIRAIGRAAGWEGRLDVVPDAELPAELQVDHDARQHLVVDTHRIRAELGYAEALTAEERMARTVAWELANPPEEPEPLGDYEARDGELRPVEAAPPED